LPQDLLDLDLLDFPKSQNARDQRPIPVATELQHEFGALASLWHCLRNPFAAKSGDDRLWQSGHTQGNPHLRAADVD
jgi:hypothetical protein